jgi:hypothetical protein
MREKEKQHFSTSESEREIEGTTFVYFELIFTNIYIHII